MKRAYRKVLLKRSFRTPRGRFDRSVNGVPTLIPERVIAQYGLPHDAVSVDEDYVPPADREEAEEPSLTSAQMESEIERQVNERMAALEAKRRAEKMEQTAERSEKAMMLDALKGNVSEVTATLNEGSYSLEELTTLRELEESGQSRKGVLIAIEASLEDLQQA